MTGWKKKSSFLGGMVISFNVDDIPNLERELLPRGKEMIKVSGRGHGKEPLRRDQKKEIRANKMSFLCRICGFRDRVRSSE